MITRKDYLKIEQTSYNINFFTKYPENVDKLKNKDHIPILKKMLGITPIDKQEKTTPSTPEEEAIEATETPEKVKVEPKPQKNNNKKKQ